MGRDDATRGSLIVHDRMYHFCKWIYPAVANYPRGQRYVLGETTTRLALRLNPRRTQIFPAADGVPWLGFRVTAPGRRRVARATVLRGARRLRGLATAYRAGEIGGQAVRDWMVSWAAHLKYGDTWRLRSSLFNSVEWTAA